MAPVAWRAPPRRFGVLLRCKGMPELPELEITARLLDSALRGARIEGALAPGINALKTFEPPLSALAGERIEGVRRRGKHLIVDTSGELALLIHLMSAGRLQLYDKRAGPRDRTSRLLVRVATEQSRAPPDERADAEAREGHDHGFGVRGLRERVERAAFRRADLKDRTRLALQEQLDEALELEALLIRAPRHALLRDQHVIAGIGRSWVDEILWQAELSPYKRGADLDAEEAEKLREVIIDTLGRAIAHYEGAIQLPIPDKLPMPLRIHRHQGEPCPRCGATLQAVHFEDYVIAYCPACQTEGRVLKDRRLSRLLR